MFFPLLLTGLAAFAATCGFTCLVRRYAPAWGLVDRPDATRKLHRGPVPLGGGIAIFLGTLTALLVALAAPHVVWLEPLGIPLDNEPTYLDLAVAKPAAALHSGLAGLLLGALLIAAVGIADDRFMLRGRQKLLGQLAAAATVVSFGLVIEGIHVFGIDIMLGPLAVPFTMFWLLGAINALNLIDGADGMASTVGGIASLALAVMAYMSGHPVEATIALALAAAIFAFLIFNFPPASIFLGDAGSMLIGLVVGVLAIRCSLKAPATVALVAPIAILAVPILDSAAAILRRQLTGRSVYQTDRGHLHHCLLRRGFSNQGMLLCVALLSSVAAVGALVSVARYNELYAALSVLAVATSLVMTRVFGYVELKLLMNRVLHFSTSLVPRRASDVPRVRERSVHLQGVRDWQRIWETLTEFADQHGLCRVRLDLNVAWLHEGFHGQWERAEWTDPAEVWTTQLPVVVSERVVGRLELAGFSGGEPAGELFPLLAEFLDSLQPDLERLVAEPQEASRPVPIDAPPLREAAGR